MRKLHRSAEQCIDYGARASVESANPFSVLLFVRHSKQEMNFSPNFDLSTAVDKGVRNSTRRLCHKTKGLAVET